MSLAAPGPVLVMGAGSIGCFVGGRLLAAGAKVAFVGRPRVLDALRAHGLRLSNQEGPVQHLAAASLALHELPPAELRPALVLLCVKCGATASAAAQLAAALPDGTPVLSLQNGVRNAEVAQRTAAALHVVPGMVAFNVADLGDGHFHRGTSGDLAAQDDRALRGWAPFFAAAGVPLKLQADLKPVLWGKLLLNLNNPVNALSGLALRAQLLDRDLRRCSAALIDEALVVLRAAGIRPAAVGGAPPHRLPAVLRLPTPLFRLLAARLLRIDAQARSSMADDLRLRRPTEIDALCGEVVHLAGRTGMKAPLNARMVALVRAAESGSPALDGASLMHALRLR